MGNGSTLEKRQRNGHCIPTHKDQIARLWQYDQAISLTTGTSPYLTPLRGFHGSCGRKRLRQREDDCKAANPLNISSTVGVVVSCIGGSNCCVIFTLYAGSAEFWYSARKERVVKILGDRKRRREMGPRAGGNLPLVLHPQSM